MGEPIAEFIAGSMAKKKLFTLWSPPVYFSMVVSFIIAKKLDVVSIRRKTVLVESILKFENASPFLVIPIEIASMFAARGRDGFPIAVHNDGAGHWCILNGRVIDNLLGNAPHADVVVTMFLEAFKPILFGTKGSQRHGSHTEMRSDQRIESE